MWVDNALTGLGATAVYSSQNPSTISLVPNVIIKRTVASGPFVDDTTITAASLFASYGVTSFISYYSNECSAGVTLVGGTGVSVKAPAPFPPNGKANLLFPGSVYLLLTVIETPTIAKVYIL